MKEFNCKHCNSKDMFIKISGTQKGLYCGDCGKWQKWLSKSDFTLAEEYCNRIKSSKNAAPTQQASNAVHSPKATYNTNSEILYRGFQVNEDHSNTIYINGSAVKGRWVYGAYCCMGQNQQAVPHIISYSEDDEFGDWIEVIGETVGQYIGHCDDEGKKIFKGDIVLANDFTASSPYNDFIGEVVYQECTYCIKPSIPENTLPFYNECATYKILRNAFQTKR